MDDRIYPGLPELPERIITTAKLYLDVEDMKTRQSHVIACKRLILFMSMDIFKKWTLQRIGAMAWMDHSNAIHHRNVAQDWFNGKSRFYHFVFVNAKAKLFQKPHYTIDQFIEEAKDLLPLKGVELTNAMIDFFFLNHVSQREVERMLKLDRGIVRKKIKGKDEYRQIIGIVIDRMIAETTNQLYDETGQISNEQQH